MNGPEGLSAQTFQSNLSNIQIDKRNTERLKGFSGKKIAYRKRLFQAVSASAGRAGKSPAPLVGLDASLNEQHFQFRAVEAEDDAVGRDAWVRVLVAEVQSLFRSFFLFHNDVV